MLRLGRLPFLVGGFVFYALGLALAYYDGVPLDGRAMLWGQIVVTAVQLMTHYANDYFDLAVDRANDNLTPWSGGSRVLPNGELPPWVAYVAALICAAVALFGMIQLLRLGSRGIPLLLLAMVLSWFYSAPPLRLHSRALGELTATFILCILTPTAAYYLQAGHFPGSLAPLIPLCFLQFNMLLTVEWPDLEGDQRTRKITLVVILGRRAVRNLYAALIFCAYLSLPLLGLPAPVAIAFTLTLPLALSLMIWIRRERVPWSIFTLLTIALVMSAAAFEMSAFLRLASN